MVKKLSQKNQGFTLVELLVVVVIIGILALVLLSKAPSMIDKTKEAKTKDALRDLRVQIKRYAAENGGIYPIAFDDVTGRKAPNDPSLVLSAFIPHYMNKMPKTSLRGGVHKDTAEVATVTITGERTMEKADMTDKGGWMYSPDTGEIRINCICEDVESTHQKDIDKKVYYYTYGYEAIE
ncbi:type II secretion system protein [Candidatus Desantisbacteria bacterium]|nr:type II secretion system protein [Candidatus Desantisbacteria bacterium]